MHTALITLTTDFGSSDSFVGVMKGVIFSIAGQAHVIDLCHGIGPGDIRHGAFVLLSAVEHFPDGTIHVGVVDPGVGTDRRVVCVCAGSQRFVGPDNGLFSWAVNRLGHTSVFSVTRTDLVADTVSATFHGRDVFAPVAAHLAAGLTPEQLGPEVTDLVELPFPQVKTKPGGELVGEVLTIDHFGNLITNIEPPMLNALDPETLQVLAGKHVITGLVSTYGSAGAGTLVALIGSAGLLEIALTGGRACQSTALAVGDPVIVKGRTNR